MKPLSFLFLCILLFPVLASLSASSGLPGLAVDPTPRHERKRTLVLAANRTKRPDVLRGLRPYRAGWDIYNRHYWASVGFTGGAGFALAALWFISFGVALAIYPFYGWGVNLNSQGSNQSQRICLMVLIMFTFAALLGCILVFVGHVKFHSEALDTLGYVVNQSDRTVEILRNVTEYLSLAKTLLVVQLLLPPDMMHDIDELTVDLNNKSDTLSEKKNENAVILQRALKDTRIILFVVAAMTFLVALTGLVLSILRYQRAILIFIITGWLLVTAAFVLLGVSIILNSAMSDTCMATGEWIENPYRESSLSHVFPCVDQRITNRTLIQSKEVANYIATGVNRFIYETANIDGKRDATQGTIFFYNQSGPTMLPLCIPFNSTFQERQCSDQEVSPADAPIVWKKSECKVSESGLCTTIGRVTPDIYTQLVGVANESYAIAHYTSLLLSLQNCKFVRDAFTGIISSHCPPLSHYLTIINVGLGLISVSFLLCLVLWILYANRPIDS